MAWATAAVAMFGAGVVGSISPCVLPLIPGYIGVLSDGNSATRPRRVALFCVAAISTFTVLGSVVAAAGGSLSVTSLAAQRVAGLLLVALGAVSLLAATGHWAPSWRPVHRLPQRVGMRAVALGVGCGAAWSPCVGPLLGAALTAAGGAGSVPRGAALLAAFGAGVVAPFVGLSLLPSPRLPQRVRRAGRVASLAVPVVLVGLGLVLLAGAYDELIQRLGIAT